MDGKQKRISLRVSDEIHKKLRRMSFENNISINNIILDALEEYLK